MVTTDPPPHPGLDPIANSGGPPPERHNGAREPLWRQALGEQLRRLRHERGETLSQTARRAGVSPQYLSEVERGVKEPSSEMVAALCGALDVTLVEVATAIVDRLGATQAVASACATSQTAYALAS